MDKRGLLGLIVNELDAVGGTNRAMSEETGIPLGDVNRIMRDGKAAEGVSLDRLVAILASFGKRVVFSVEKCEASPIRLRRGAGDPSRAKRDRQAAFVAQVDAMAQYERLEREL